MKNLYLIPTDKPSRLHYFTANKAGYYLYPNNKLVVPRNPNCINQHIYITSDEEIIEGDYFLYDETEIRYKTNGTEYHGRDLCHISGNRRYPVNKSKKIILTTDQDLIKNGVQDIDDEFLEWFVKNPSCEEVEVADYGNVLFDDKVFHMYKIIIPKEEPKQETNLKKHLDSCEEYQGPRRSAIVDKQETLGDAAEKYAEIYRCPATNDNEYCKHDIISAINFGAKWQQERMYSEEEVRELLLTQRGNSYVAILTKTRDTELASLAMSAPEPSGKNGWVKQFKKKISK